MDSCTGGQGSSGSGEGWYWDERVQRFLREHLDMHAAATVWDADVTSRAVNLRT